MITIKQRNLFSKIAQKMATKAGIILTKKEIDSMDVADFGLNRLETEGAQILALADTEYLSIRLIALTPNQTEPEHWHTTVGKKPGKEETIRVMCGTIYFYTPGPDTMKMGKIPSGKEKWYTCRHERVMRPGDQITLTAGTRHWFQAGPEGAVVFCFCSAAVEALDNFTDPSVVRVTKVV
jgi:D-lyxose ketol-isomerase